jgi:hypothetical protein
MGIRRRSWETWARARYPGIRLAGDEALEGEESPGDVASAAVR